MSAQSSYLNKKGPFRLLQTLRLLSISRLGLPCSADLYIF